MRIKLLIVLSILSFWGILYQFMPVRVYKKTVEIPYGESSLDTAIRLYREGIIRSPFSFLTIHALFRGKLEAGEYEFDGIVFPWDAYRKIRYGLRKLYKITVPEGYDLYDIAKLLEEKKICSSKDFLEYALSPKTVKKYGLATYSMEGFLFPDTYFFSKNTHPSHIVDVMFKNFMKKTAQLRQELPKKGLTLEKWVIIASMIEKETALPSEKPLVAAVIYNRIKENMKLQIDPTVIYALKRRGMWEGILTKKDLNFEDPYNTYVYYGLPPTPICNPGLDSLKAALYPANVPYLYFVADGTGKHSFSVDYQDHLRKVRLYRR
ncbi:endolytic transglycosylase MltG [Thermocrinis minervae]|uniref:Endolytic murein transglycosylase n=1 Tax=Thermocrinis minervae TaxID=381751 RepID=A0A1M6QXI0_9AQUI|nr:endolytic transglycosylase MltG [Thermocrinis minervae]SHK24982.1 UPF0755 protein [Thermocrinis minervae]